MNIEAILFTLAAIGVDETVYLIKSRLRAERPICPIGGNCHVVLESKYKNIFVIPTDVLGLIFYATASVLSAFLVIGIGPAATWILLLKVMAIVGSLVSLFFTYIQYQVIKEWCFWCLTSAFTIWLITAILLLNNLHYV